MPCVKNDNYQVFAHTYPYEFSFDPIAIEVEASIQPTACNKITILCCNFINSLQILFHSVQRPELDCLYMYCHTASYYTRIIYYTRLYISPTLLPLSMIPNHSLLLLLLVLIIRSLLHPVDRLLPRNLSLLSLLPHDLGLLFLHHHPFSL